MADGFTFRWGPGRLAGLGINLSPDQAACTETTGKALVVTAEMEPHPKYGWAPMHHPDLGWLVRPAVVDVVLNDQIMVPVAMYEKQSGNLIEEFHKPMRRQDLLDKTEGQGWRTYGRLVAKYGQTDPVTDLVTDDTSIPLWSGVMIGDSQASNILQAAAQAYKATDLPAWEEYRELTDCGWYEDEEDDEFAERWERVCNDLRIEEPSGDHGWWGDSQPEWIWERCVPEYGAFMNDEDRVTWNNLVASARQNWDVYRTLLGRSPSQYKSYADISTDPF